MNHDDATSAVGPFTTQDPDALPDDAATLGVVPAERYMIGAEVGRGGMGRIYQAEDVRLGRVVALKLPRDPGAPAEAALRQEALVTARLQHPAIVPIYEAGRLSTGQPFYAMRLVKGRPLEAAIADAPTLAARLALLPQFIAAAQAVAYAHGEGVVHRDLKPHNVLVGTLGEVVVIDWGVAATIGAAAPRVAGTPAYMPPEQARGEPPDPRADVFALGMMLRHLLAGDARAELERATPRELIAIIAHATALDPAQRYRDAAELAVDLTRFTAGQLVLAHRYSGRERVLRFLRRHRALVALSVVALFAVSALIIYNIVSIADERDEAERHRDALLLAQAKVWLERDPTAAVAWLHAYAGARAADPDELRAVAAEADARGVARHVLRGLRNPSIAPGAARLVALDSDGIVRVDLDPPTRTLVSRDADGVRAFTWSHDGKTLAVLDERRVRLFDAQTTALVRELALPRPSRVVAFAPDGQTLYVGGSGGALLALGPDGTRALVGHEGTITSLEVSKSRLLTTSADGTARLWDVARGTSEVLPDSAVRTGAYADLSPKGDRVAWSSADGKVRWRAVEGGPISALEGHRAEVTMVAFSHDGRSLISGSHDYDVRIWDLASGTSTVLDAHDNVVLRVVPAPDDVHLLTASLDRDVLLWDLATGDRRALTGHNDAITAAAFAGDRLVVADGDQVREWDIGAHDTRVFRGHTSAATVVMAVGERPFTFSDDGTFRLWDVATGTARVWPTPGTQLGGGAIHPSKTFVASSSDDHSVWTMEVDSGKTRVLGHHDAMVHNMEFSPDGRWLATTSSDRTVKVWDVASGAVRVLEGHESPTWFVAWSADSKRLATGGDDPVVRVYDLASGARTDLVGHARRISDVAFAGDVVVSASADATIRVWDPAGARVLRGHQALVSMLQVSRDGRTLASSSDDGTVRLWDLASERSRVLPHDAPLVFATFTDDGAHLVSGTTDGAVRVFDATNGHLLVVRRDHDAAITDAFLLADQRTLVTSSEDMTLRVTTLAALQPPDLDALTSARIGKDDRPETPLR